MKACELYGVSQVYVSGLRSHIPDEQEIKELNLEVYKFMKEEEDVIKGYCYVNPSHSNSSDVLKQGIEEYGMSGMKLWVSTFCDDPRVFPLVEQCIEYDIPILIHAFHKAVGQLKYESYSWNVANLARKYPEAKIIMAHMAANCYTGLKPIKDLKNVWVDFSGTIIRGDDILYAKKAVGVERILFGTDMPGASALICLGQVEEADLSPEEKELIYYRNALSLFTE
jgi:predicted TIM-barrel fold metal-dependent hydrolase